MLFTALVIFQIDMKAAEKQRLQKRMAELRADRDRLAELLELKDRQLAECRAEATHYEHRVSNCKHLSMALINLKRKIKKKNHTSLYNFYSSNVLLVI